MSLLDGDRVEKIKNSRKKIFFQQKQHKIKKVSNSFFQFFIREWYSFKEINRKTYFHFNFSIQNLRFSFFFFKHAKWWKIHNLKEKNNMINAIRKNFVNHFLKQLFMHTHTQENEDLCCRFSFLLVKPQELFSWEKRRISSNKIV